MVLTLLKENNAFRVFGHILGARLGFGIGKAETLNVHGHKVVLRRGSPDLIVALTSLGGEFDILKQSIDNEFQGLIIDAGGYIGTAAMAMSDLFPDATIISIEASATNVEQARLNTSSFKKISIVHAALSAESAPEQIALNDRGTGDWGFTIVGKPADRVAREIEKVETITIGRILEQAGFDNAGIVKLDIEGGELELFRDSDWLNDVEVLLVELHDRIAPGCEEAFHQATAGRHNSRTNGEKFISLKRAKFEA